MKYISTLLSFCSLLLLFGIVQADAQDTLKIVASGTQSVPPVSTNGTGIFEVIKTEDSLTVQGDFEELESYYTGAYIQMAKQNETGNMLYQLSATDLNEDHTAGTFKASDNTFHIPESVEQYYEKGMLYINIATNQHPQGEIRGQIVTR